SKFKAASKREQSQACLSYAEREQTREDLQVLPKFKVAIKPQTKAACRLCCGEIFYFIKAS
ncbi:MAG: hypothetical protein Q4F45_07355, partial [Alistipes sp.]|nr:hypothetical protein [Alistipes sp.]